MAEKIVRKTASPVPTGIKERQLFLPSESLNSKDFASLNFIDRKEGGGDDKESSCLIHDFPLTTTIVACYRDRPSFYKASKKSRRTANRIYKAIVGGDAGNVCDGYFIGRHRPQQGVLPGENDEYDKALHRRLESEFGPCIHDAIVDIGLSDTRNPSSEVLLEEATSLELFVTKFGCQRGDDSLENPVGRNIGVLFMDLDTIARDTLECIFDNPSASARRSHDILNNILNCLSTQQNSHSGICWIVHVKSEILHRLVSSTVSRDDACAFSVTGEELLKKSASHPSYNSSNNRDVASDGTSNNLNLSTIRRLRENKGAAHCPLSLYPARYIELYSSANKPSSKDNNGDVPHQTKIREICRFHNYDSERGCLRSKKALEKFGLKGCDMDHGHCHNCGTFGHLALECPISIESVEGGSLEPVVFLKNQDGTFSSKPLHQYQSITGKTGGALPALFVLGGRLRGRTLAACEMLPLSPSGTEADEIQWQMMPNLLEHRGR